MFVSDETDNDHGNVDFGLEKMAGSVLFTWGKASNTNREPYYRLLQPPPSFPVDVSGTKMSDSVRTAELIAGSQKRTEKDNYGYSDSHNDTT